MKPKSFLFDPASSVPLAAVRIGLGIVLIAQALMTRTAIWDFFSSSGLLQGELAAALSHPGVPTIHWLAEHLTSYGVSESSCIFMVTSLYFGSLCFLTVGLFTRGAAGVAWFLHWTLMNSADSTNYGIDMYAHVFLFYLIWVPAGDAWSVDAISRGVWDRVTPAARLGLRVLQVQLCLSYVSSGIDKIKGEQWRTGDVLFRALSLPLYKQFELNWIAHWPRLTQMMSWSTLVMELGYCIFIWPKTTRKFWIAGIVGLHMGIIIFLGLTLFGSVMCVLTLGAFAFSPEPRSTAPCELEPEVATLELSAVV